MGFDEGHRELVPFDLSGVALPLLTESVVTRRRSEPRIRSTYSRSHGTSLSACAMHSAFADSDERIHETRPEYPGLD